MDLGKWIITFKGIRSIAITASEWTACEAYKHGRQTHFSRFALQGIKDFVNIKFSIHNVRENFLKDLIIS